MTDLYAARIAEALKSPTLVEELRLAYGIGVTLYDRQVDPRRPGDHGFKLGAHRARILDALLTDIDRAREQTGAEERIAQLARAIAVLAGAPL